MAVSAVNQHLGGLNRMGPLYLRPAWETWWHSVTKQQNGSQEAEKSID